MFEEITLHSANYDIIAETVPVFRGVNLCDYLVEEYCNIAFILTTRVRCENCKTALEERFPVFQGKIAIMFHIFF